MEKLDLKKYGREILLAKNNPKKLDNINITLTGWFCYFSEQLIELEIGEAKFWGEHKHLESDKPTSDTTIKALWRITPMGADHLRAEMYCKSIEKTMSSLKSSLRRLEVESRNQA